jgi:hypothetical protein
MIVPFWAVNSAVKLFQNAIITRPYLEYLNTFNRNLIINLEVNLETEWAILEDLEMFSGH